MALVKFDPEITVPEILEEFFSETLPGFFNRKSFSTPSVNISETNNSYEVEVAAPGFNKKDFKVKIENGVLSVSAENKKEKEEKNKRFRRKEFSYSSFQRSFVLPETIEEDKIEANYTNGVLSIFIPKKEEAKEKGVKEISIK